MDIPERSGTWCSGSGRPRSEAKAVRALAEPRHRVGPAHTQQRERHHNRELAPREAHEELVVDHDHRGDEGPEHQQESPLLDQVGLAGFVNQVRDLGHGPMHRKLTQIHIRDEPEAQSQHAYPHPDEEEQPAGNPAHRAHARQVRQYDICFTSVHSCRTGGRARGCGART